MKTCLDRVDVAEQALSISHINSMEDSKDKDDGNDLHKRRKCVHVIDIPIDSFCTTNGSGNDTGDLKSGKKETAKDEQFVYDWYLPVQENNKNRDPACIQQSAEILESVNADSTKRSPTYEGMNHSDYESYYFANENENEALLLKAMFLNNKKSDKYYDNEYDQFFEYYVEDENERTMNYSSFSDDSNHEDYFDKEYPEEGLEDDFDEDDSVVHGTYSSTDSDMESSRKSSHFFYEDDSDEDEDDDNMINNKLWRRAQNSKWEVMRIVHFQTKHIINDP